MLGHIGICVSDLEGAKEFFRKYFSITSNGLYHNPKTGFSSYFLSFPQGEGHIEIMNSPDMLGPQNGQPGLAHIAIRLGSKKAVDDLIKRFALDGYRVLLGPRTTADGYYEALIEGYESLKLEITE